MRYFSIFAIIGILLCGVACGPSPEKAFLQNGGFEDGNLEGWKAINNTENAEFDLSQENVRSGKYCLLLNQDKEGSDVFTLKNTLSEDPPLFQYLKLTGYIRATNLAGINIVAESDKGIVARASTQKKEGIPDDGNWHPVEAKIHIPLSAQKLMVQCWLKGKGDAWFDDLSIQKIDPEYGIPARLEGPGLVRVAGAEDFIVRENTDKLEIIFPLPLTTEFQVPLNFWLDINPREKLVSSEIFQRLGPNWCGRVTLGPLMKDEIVELRYWSDVLMLKADYTHVPEKAPIPSPENYPQEVKKWLQPTISVQSDDDRIIAEAKQIMEKVGNPDAVAFIREMLNRITKIKFEKPKGCDAVSMLEQGGACTSHANLGAALCRVVGIPARVIACYPTWNIPFQTHYIIEAYIDGFGWIPAETSMNQFPFQSYKQVYVSKVQIEDEKDSFDAFRLAAPGVPRWSLNEMDARLATWNNKEKPLGQPYCDHIASPLTQFSDDSNLIEAFHKAKELWEKYLKAKTGTESYPGLVKSLEAGLEEIPTSPKDLIKALQQTLKE